MGLATAAILGGTALIGSSIASKGAKKAAGIQADATLQASRESIDFQRELFDQQMQSILPQRIVGEQALFGLSDLLGVSRPTESLVMQEAAQMREDGGTFAPIELTEGVGADSSPAGSGIAALAASPDYQFRLNTGLDAVESSAAARGLSRSGRGLASVMDYAQGPAAGEFNNRFNRLAALAGMGQSATSQGNSLSNAFASNVGNQMFQAGSDVGAIRASGIAGSANAWGQGISSLGNIAAFAAGGGFGGGSNPGASPNIVVNPNPYPVPGIPY